MQVARDLNAFAAEAWNLADADRRLRSAALYARLDRLQMQIIDYAVAETPVPGFPPANLR